MYLIHLLLPTHPDPADIHAGVALSLLIKLEADLNIKV